MKTGIFGGAFNPVHNGHLALASSYFAALQLDRIIFVPTYIAPHKSSDDFAPAEDRINMLKIAVDEKSRFEVSDIEFKLGGKSYSYNTLCEMKKMYPDDDFFLIVGADQYLNFHQWYRANDILDIATVVSAAREKGNLEQLKVYRASHKNMKETLISDFDVLEVSSSEIRKKIKAGESVDGLLPLGVAEYIVEKKLYV